MEKKKKFNVPHVYILLLAMILVFAVLTYIIPAGQYDMMTIVDNPETGHEREVVNPESFRYVENTPVTLLQFLTAVPRGLQEVAQIVFFIFIVGGSMTVINETRAIEAGMGRLIKALKGKTWVVIPVVMFFFSLCGAVFGMAEETIPFVPIFVALMIAAGYDSMTGAAIVLVGAGAGFTGAFINPFTIQVAQGIAQVEILSGMTFRLVMYVCFVALAMAFVLRYAAKIKKDPTLSSMHEEDKLREDLIDLEELPEFDGRRKGILIVFVIGIIFLVYAVVTWGWYMDEIAALFLGMSWIIALIDKDLGFNSYATTLGRGMAEITGGALVVGFARGVLVVMNDGNILHTILHSCAGFLGQLPSMVSALGMYVFQCLLSFIVPSGSGQASVSMPILAPLSDLVGVTRQTSCIAFQMGDGISNILTPTSGYFMAALALARISFAKWVKWFLPLVGLQYLLGAIFIVAAQMMELQ
ncbi:MAG: AbgT family transporter [Anaerovoracaceae bacterium]|nr:AbgT family transporter [Anaerovoracaceae bacterium]